MSGASKRLQDEGSHATTSKMSAEEGCMSSTNPGKLIQTVISECHAPFGQVLDGRAGKVQRLEPCDVDKRSSLLPMHQISFSVNASCLDHPVAAESRPELKGSQDGRDPRSEIAEARLETRKSHGDLRVDAQVSETENNVRQESMDEKGLRSELTQPDQKSDIRVEKDGTRLTTASVPHLNRKDPKDHHRGTRYTESPKDGLYPWFAMLYGSRNIAESGKDISTYEEKAELEAHEAVGENRLGLKREEKSKDKEQRRRDDKHRDYVERDKERSEHRNNLQRCDTSNQCKEYVREDREAERLDRERKDAQKDKERKDGEKNHLKRELSNSNDNSFRNEEMLERHVKILEKETSESKKHKELNNWKAVDRSVNDNKRDRDSDTDADKHEKRSCYEKECEDGRTGIIRRDREAFGYGIQQRRRMLRSRGTPQSSNREPHFRSRARENEGSQGESEVSAITYKVGECVQELLKLWKEFEASLDGEIVEDLQNCPTLEIQIPTEHVSATNRQVRGGQLWGTDIYTNDSDLVAVLMHTGYCRPTTSLPSPAIQELHATIRVLPPQNCYYSTLRNNVRSRAWGAGIGCSFRVESCCMVKKGGGSIDLEPRLILLSAVEPTLAPVSVERTMTTRAAASNALKRQRFVREVTIQYNLCNEPWVKYSINAVADKGLKRSLYTSARLKKGEVLYLESHSNRYELCFSGAKAVENGTMIKSSRASESGQRTQNHISHVQTADTSQEHDSTIDVYRWSRCKKPLPQKVMLSIGIPLPSEHVEVLLENLDWEDVQWSQIGVWVAGKEYDLVRVHFLSPN